MSLALHPALGLPSPSGLSNLRFKSRPVAGNIYSNMSELEQGATLDPRRRAMQSVHPKQVSFKWPTG
jgi:hypothetical protein